MDAKYWNEVYAKKAEAQRSWFQLVPQKSLELIDELGLSNEAEIIDVGGGDSRLVDALLKRGFHRLTVLDISSQALEAAKLRLGSEAQKVSFVCSDVTEFKPKSPFTLWHDRAAFHFLTSAKQIKTYVDLVNRTVSKDGYLIISTFSKKGPEKCSGLPITQYAQEDLQALFAPHFKALRCFDDAHTTPSGAIQNFVYCCFQKNE